MKNSLLAGILLSVLSGHGTAATGKFFTEVDRVISANELFGGCMALLTIAPSSLGLDCPRKFVTFSCSGDFATKDQAKRNFELVQMAMLFDTRIQIVVDDTKKHNGYCFVNRVDVEKP